MARRWNSHAENWEDEQHRLIREPEWFILETDDGDWAILFVKHEAYRFITRTKQSATDLCCLLNYAGHKIMSLAAQTIQTTVILSHGDE